MRFDYEQLLSGTFTIGVIILQSLSVTVLKRLGALFPAIGETIGGILGLGVGIYLAQWLSFGIGALLYHRLGYKLRTLILPGFKQETSGRILWFGARITIGKLSILIGAIAQGAHRTRRRSRFKTFEKPAAAEYALRDGDAPDGQRQDHRHAGRAKHPGSGV